MDVIKLVKIALIAIVVIVILFRIISKIKTRQDPFLTLTVASDHRDILVPKTQRSQLENIIEQYSNKPYERYDNLAYKLSELLLDPLPNLIQQSNEVEYFQRLNKPQRVFSLAMQFEGQVDNGGVYQFIWNRPLSMYAMKDALNELNIDTLASDYGNVLKELEKNADDYGKDRQYWNNPNISQDDKWRRFQEGRKYIPAGTKIEEYFYDEAFKMKWHQLLINYVRQHIDKFIGS